MQEAVWESPRDVRVALEKLGLTVDVLQNVVMKGYVARISRTENDAPNAGGLYHWNETLRVLREYLVTQQWKRSNENGFPTIINPENSVAICVYSGTEFTGISHKTPATKNLKGPCTADRVASNQEMLLFPELAEERPIYDDQSAVKTWALLFYVDDHEIRSELSLPIDMDNNGQIIGWKERIILPAIPLDDEGGHGAVAEPDFGPDVDIEIRRRA